VTATEENVSKGRLNVTGGLGGDIDDEKKGPPTTRNKGPDLITLVPTVKGSMSIHGKWDTENLIFLLLPIICGLKGKELKPAALITENPGDID